jgi:hypothetical protein
LYYEKSGNPGKRVFAVLTIYFPAPFFRFFHWIFEIGSRRGDWIRGKKPGANSTTVSYNASVINIYNATSSLVHLENKKIVHIEKALQPTYCNAAVVVVNSYVVGLAPRKG